MRIATLVPAVLVLAAQAVAAQAPYYPDAGAWERRSPEAAGLNAARLADAVAFAQQNEASTPRDLEMAHYASFGREPFGEAIGFFKERGPQTGIIIRGGYIVAEWGDPARVDMTFSVTKSFLSTTVGLAYDQGLIRDVNDLVHTYMAPIFPAMSSVHTSERSSNPFGSPMPIDLFAGEHNRTLTWDHLLRQVSDWEGTLWGKPEWADRPARETATWLTRPRAEPGSAYEYNDTRVNVLALAALNVWRRPLPEILREHVMDPMGASPTWRWLGYDNSWVVIDGQRVQSVSGGGHWGGGMFINAYDQARFGLLTLRDGRWRDRQLISEEWLRMAHTPTPAQPTYGFMNFFLNTDRALYPSAPPEAFAHLGNGTNLIYCDPVNDLVVVARWIDNRQVDAFIGRVLAALEN
jgi:CubicO group peptidase (beta-lactamase class C family)